jgi:hypothetical protein
MSLTLKDSGGGNFKAVPPGNHVARCIGVIDIGTQTTEYEGVQALKHQLILKYEVLGEDDAGVPMTVDYEGGSMPMTISKWLTASMNQKATLRGWLASWRGRDFTPEELKGFAVDSVLGSFCMLNVTQTETKDGKTRSKAAAISPVPAAMRKMLPKGVHPLVSFDIDKPDMKVLEEFHEKLQETIKSSQEWKARSAPKPVKKPEPELVDMEDDIPF